ncbi:ParB/RepB/Spo0J family partition protein [Halomonas sp. CnH100-B]|uniref:Probable chromosome-partitioning protein ParB n=1 Tax=Vreelandella aquamarina TaxID=77097 RepID=A0A857GQB9_9GAMM|nr:MULTISPECIES: ParB/RepB/Spo0J family partition protein [Halomonas]HAZ98977.1 chromosome partitioning protein ParB [Halomonas sp.]MCO7229940.1 ParB/RepB/Spo0J family partition protein [Halomonas sp. CnH100-B]MDK9688422.1 ParB/RepB/Spo0J family partition protein [Halomonas sp. LC1]QHD51440.1 chromosome partitioning protein ParB [Halomonas meridiana]HBM28164.1 chromosome partitioning protein ParB [Halomonas sp.]|tara:strand:+ start:543 stop:1472 length:930 start_codon:yes stop_codon:yes gene_type:complete
MTRKRALGRGLDALIGAGARRRDSLDLTGGTTLENAETPLPEGMPDDATAERLERLPLGQLTRGKYQPRRDIQPEALEELADSIRAQGVMQPIVVRPIGNDRYEIIAGERRWRAAQLAELDVIPAVIRYVSDEVALALALIENIQRENLNAIEEALALKRLGEEFELTQQQIADAVGKSRTQVANLLRLLALDPEVQTLLERGDLDMGHARALLSLTSAQQRQVAHEVVNKDLTVRDTEALVKKVQTQQAPVAPTKQSPKTPDVARLETHLGELLGAPVSIDHGQKGKGKVTIRYTSLEELDGILSHIK